MRILLAVAIATMIAGCASIRRTQGLIVRQVGAQVTGDVPATIVVERTGKRHYVKGADAMRYFPGETVDIVVENGSAKIED